MVQGRQNKVMAGDLGLSQRTVEIHRAHVMEKMGAHSVAQLVRMVLDTREPSARAARAQSVTSSGLTKPGGFTTSRSQPTCSSTRAAVPPAAACAECGRATVPITSTSG